MSFLVIDIGNTRLKWGLYAAPRPGAELLAHGASFLETIDRLADDEWARLPSPTHMLGCAVAGLAVRRRAEEQLDLWDLVPRWVVSQPVACGVTNGYDHPARLGSDRWVAMIGARARVLASGAPRPALVVMVGTAVTVDALDAEGRFLGGLILPGFGLMLKAMESGTAGLKVPTGEVHAFPTNTSDALMSGGTYGIAGAIERMHRHLVRRCGEPPVLLMSGGAAVKLAPETDLPFELTDTLVFEGLLQLAAAGPAQGG
ncbi:type III pantothenate kinase [Sphaerotilus sp.]|uniref:type III pantothenate kinase n=1 Tax=Sphaerotilus sp. TaxID=2093942 RepID=UPI002ACD25B1|nr:type III pantothenate kinase [Sphaerotilus sp.]MDZ7854983.1 type III pantothenate kinase [Sphaerotilus sp.]